MQQATPPAISSDLAALDHAHLWHPFTPMRQWCEQDPLVITDGEGPYLIDADGERYIDGVSSLWCNVHGHRVPQIDAAVRDQLDRIAHTTMLGLTSPPAVEFAAKLVDRVNRGYPEEADAAGRLNKVFYSDAGATAVEVAFKMAVGYWYHQGRPEKNKFIGLAGAYHGDTTGTMSVGYSDLFHKPFVSMVFEVSSFPAVDALRQTSVLTDQGHLHHGAHAWPSEHDAAQHSLLMNSLDALRRLLEKQDDQTAAICIEPVMQGAAGMICQPPGFVAAVARLARQYDVLLILDEVATGFGRTGSMFGFEQEAELSHCWPEDEIDFRFHGPDILCLAKGITGGYLPLAATLTTDVIYDAFTGELHEKKTLFHGHTYTGNPLACAAAIASLDLFDQPTQGSPDMIAHTRASAELIARKLDALRGHPHVIDIRQRGLMVGIELGTRRPDGTAEPFDFSKRTGYAVCDKLRRRGIIIRPLGDVLVLMPIPAMGHDVLGTLLDQFIAEIERHTFT
ncbi:MAG: adenosylmethionine--8-amino-7-oxononanoate transaminase [Planctomycetota bacterium]